MECWVILFLIATSQVSAEDLPKVHINDGNLRGQYAISYKGEKYMEFVGIPYAQPPIGALRYEEPQAVQPWSGTWIANISTACLQVNHWPEPEGGRTEGEEDCLHLNVFVPGTKIDPSKKLDVIVHYHSGAFNFGHGQCYAGPKYLMDRDVILVTMNYRLGLLGFLSTGDEHLPGNLGMKDQVAALKWVNKNIKHFGGNDKSITISGLSAGSGSTHYHYLSPLSRGLFARGISMSGCALNPWVLQEKALETTKIVAKALGCPYDDNKDMVECIKWRNGKQIIEATRLLRPWLFNSHSPVGPVIDSASKNPFLPEHPYKMMSEGNINDVPWIASITTSEGLYPGADFMVKDNFLPDLERRWDDLAPHIMHYMHTVPENLKSVVNAKAKEYYLKGKSIGKETYPELIQMLGDRIYLVDIQKAVRLQAKANKSPVYFYQFDYTGEERISFVYLFTTLTEKFGVCHGDDALYIFSDLPKKIEPKLPPVDEKMKELMLDMWMSYVKTGIPNVPGWSPVDKNPNAKLNYLFIGPQHQLEPRTAKELGHFSFWESLPFEENERLLAKQREEL